MYVYENYIFDYMPFYVGVGINDRMNDHLNEVLNNRKKSHTGNQLKYNKIRKIISNGQVPIVVKLCIGARQDMLVEEQKIISLVGRVDLCTGTLTNLTDGGELNLGKSVSVDTKKKISESQMGRTHSDEVKQRISVSNKGKRIGHKHTEQSIEKIKNSRKNQVISHSEHTRKKMSDAQKGDNHYNFGKSLDAEWKLKISEAKTGSVHTEETKKKISESKTGSVHTEETKKKMSTSRIKYKVEQFTKDGVLIKTWDSTVDIRDVLGHKVSCISVACSTGKSLYGFIWKYIKK